MALNHPQGMCRNHSKQIEISLLKNPDPTAEQDFSISPSKVRLIKLFSRRPQLHRAVV